jgi:hypothetical protein
MQRVVRLARLLAVGRSETTERVDVRSRSRVCVLSGRDARRPLENALALNTFDLFFSSKRPLDHSNMRADCWPCAAHRHLRLPASPTLCDPSAIVIAVLQARISADRVEQSRQLRVSAPRLRNAASHACFKDPLQLPAFLLTASTSRH